MVEETRKDSLKSLTEELKAKIARDKPEDIEWQAPEKPEKDIPDKKIQELSEKISKKEVEEEKKSITSEGETLISLENYIKCAVHLGTKVITPHMKKYVYKRRADGLAVINTVLIDKKLREAIDFIKEYDPKTIYLCCKREAGWSAARRFEDATGIKVFTKKYSPGITTNLELEDFFEAELTMICDPWIDKNALNDTIKLKKPIVGLCDTNNYTLGVTKIIPCNNKSSKSIGCILFILAREFCKTKKIPFKYQLEDFSGKLE